MTVSDDLFQLIKSLPKAEKIYFKKFVSLFIEKESSNYLKLFNEIEKQASKENDYDEKKVKKGNYSGKFIKNLSYHKNYLYSMIMTSLVLYKKDNKDVILLQQLIAQAEILHDKMLFNQSRKVLQRAKKIATEKEFLTYLYDILELEKIIGGNLSNTEDLEKNENQIYSEQLKILEDLKTDQEYCHIHSLMTNKFKKLGTGLLRNRDELAEIEMMLQNGFLKDERKAKSFTSKKFLYGTMLQYSLAKNDYEGAYEYVKKVAHLWEENIGKTRQKFDHYIFTLNNLLTIQIRTKRFDECEDTVLKIKQVEKKFPGKVSDRNKVFIFHSVSVLMMTKHFACYDTEGLLNHINEVESKISRYENKIILRLRIILYYFLGLSNFVLSNFEKCIYWMVKIFNVERTDVSQDYQCYSRILYLISYYELGHIDSLEYALRSVYHFLSKRKRVYKYENIILQYLRKSFRIKTQAELMEMFEDMKRDMEKIYNDPFEQNAFDAFNILYWLESKLKKKPLMEVMKLGLDS